MQIPKNTIAAIEGLFYKIGRFGWVYYYQCGDWFKSSRSKEEIAREVRKQDPQNLFSLTDDSPKKKNKAT